MKGDAVSRVWALSLPGTTDWAAFGRQVSGAWSVAWSPPPPPAHGTSPEGVRARSHPLHPSGHAHASPQNPHGAPLSLPGPSRTGGTRVYPPLCGGGWCGVPSQPPRGVPIPPRPRQDRRDSGVSAAVWGWVVWCPLKTPTGRPYPSPAQAGPEGLGCIRRCVGVGGVVSPQNPHGASLSLPGPGRTGGTRVYPSLCGGVPPRHRPRGASP